MNKEAESALLAKLDDLSGAVQILLEEKARRDGDSARRIEAICKDITATFKAHGANVNEMYMALSIAKRTLDDAYFVALKPPVETSDGPPKPFVKR